MTEPSRLDLHPKLQKFPNWSLVLMVVLSLPIYLYIGMCEIKHHSKLNIWYGLKIGLKQWRKDIKIMGNIKDLRS